LRTRDRTAEFAVAGCLDCHQLADDFRRRVDELLSGRGHVLAERDRERVEQRTDRRLAYPADLSLGHEPVQRWNLPDGWVISAHPAHPPL
jgi:hypothetical protein